MQMFENRGSEIRKPVRQRRRRAEHIKPPMSYIAMISSAILSSPEKKMTLTEINEYLMDHHECFRGEYQGWRNSVRHNLSFNKCFVKILRNPARPWAKDNHWGVIVDLLDGYLMENGKFRRRRKRQEQACRVQTITPTRRSVSSKETKPAKSDEPVYFPVAPPPDETVLLRPLCTRSYLMDAQQDHLSLAYNTNKPDKCSTTGLFPAAQTHNYNASALYTSHFKFNTTKSFSAGALQDRSSLPCTCINSPYNYSFNATSSFSATQREYVSHSYDRLYKWNSTGSFPVAHQVLSNLSSNSSTIDSLPTSHHDHSSLPCINSAHRWSTAASLPAAEKIGFLCNSPSKRIAFSIENILGNSHQLEAGLQPDFYHPEQHGSSKIDVTGDLFLPRPIKAYNFKRRKNGDLAVGTPGVKVKRSINTGSDFLTGHGRIDSSLPAREDGNKIVSIRTFTDV